MAQEPPTVAFVLSGGASRGAVQVGMLRALTEAGIRPDLLVGTSVGALNAMMFAADPTLDGLDHMRRLWVGAPRSQIFPVTPVESWRHVRARDGFVFSNGGLERWIASNVQCLRLENSPIPVHVMATDVATGGPVRLSSGDTVSALLASLALPGVFAPVERGGLELVDGGRSANTPVSDAIDLGASQIFVLSPHGAPGQPEPTERPSVPRRINEAVLETLDRWIGTAAPDDADPDDFGVEGRQPSVDIIRLPAPVVSDASPFSFRRSDRLISDATELTRAWIADHPNGLPAARSSVGGGLRADRDPSRRDRVPHHV